MTVQPNKPLAPVRLLSASRVILAQPAMTKEELISSLLRTVCQDRPALDCADIIAQVLKREQGISTTLDTGLSIPHARLEEIDSFQAALALVPGGMKDPQSHLQIKAMFLFLSPAKPEFFQGHLQILAGLAQTFTAGFIDELSSLPSAQAVWERLSR